METFEKTQLSWNSAPFDCARNRQRAVSQGVFTPFHQRGCELKRTARFDLPLERSAGISSSRRYRPSSREALFAEAQQSGDAVSAVPS
jgi:hypothetical protein